MHVPNRLACIAAAALLLVLATVFTAITAAQTTPAPGSGTASAKPKPPARIFVKKADGTSVRGELVDADGLRLTVRPVEGKTLGEPVEIKWADVKTVSNGLTREKAMKAWKDAHKDKLCEDCRGERVARCDACKGTGHDPAASKECKTCKGELLVDCTDKRCEKGKTACPAPCLKLSEGVWSQPDAEGKRYRTFNLKGGGWVKFSEGHVGEVVKYMHGTARGLPCEVCGRTGSVPCPTCGARGDLPCPTCKAEKAAADCATCDGGNVECVKCKGSGLKA